MVLKIEELLLKYAFNSTNSFGVWPSTYRLLIKDVYLGGFSVSYAYDRFAGIVFMHNWTRIALKS